MYSTGNYAQYFIITCKRKESEKNMYVCKTESLSFPPENYHNTVNQLYFNKKKIKLGKTPESYG